MTTTNDAERDQLIIGQRALLAHNIATAKGAIGAAQITLARLRSEQVYDVEFAEGYGSVVERFLTRAWDDMLAAQLVVKDSTR